MSFLFRIKHCLLDQFALPSILPLSPKSWVPVRLVPARPKTIKYQTPYPYRHPKLKGSESISCTRRMLSSRRREGDGPSTGTGTDEQYRDPSSNPKVSRLREVIGSADTSDGWEKSWEEGVIPWDLGKPTPVLVRLVKSNSLPKGRALVPGCGTGYDVVALASSERYVVGLDISGTAIIKAKQWSDSFPNKNQFTFLNEDFFTWKPEQLFDLIFDYTFFCAIDPFMRPAWAKRINQILKPNGELITLIYLISDQKEGPPFNNSLSDYEEVLNPLEFKAISIEDNELAVKPRRGSEKLVRWKKIMKQSSL